MHVLPYYASLTTDIMMHTSCRQLLLHSRYTTPEPYTDSLTDTLALLALAKPHVGSTPLIAAGGIMTGQQVLAAVAAGAAGVQMGTAFLAADEAGTSKEGREMLLSEPDRGTTVTQVRVSLGPTGPRLASGGVQLCHAHLAPWPSRPACPG